MQINGTAILLMLGNILKSFYTARAEQLFNSCTDTKTRNIFLNMNYNVTSRDR